MAGSILREADTAGLPDVRASDCDRCSGHLPKLRWPHHFFAIASFSRSALSWASAYIFSGAGSRPAAP